MYKNPLTRHHERTCVCAGTQQWQKYALDLREEFGQEQVQINYRIQMLLRELEEIVERDWDQSNVRDEMI